MSNKPTTCKITVKPYVSRCCKHPRNAETNHYGAVYLTCPKCGELAVWDCTLPCPEDMALPEEWTIVKLGDVADFIEGISI